VSNEQGNGEDVAPLWTTLDINERLVSQQLCFTGCHRRRARKGGVD
jgi:hypothetical protein